MFCQFHVCIRELVYDHVTDQLVSQTQNIARRTRLYNLAARWHVETSPSFRRKAPTYLWAVSPCPALPYPALSGSGRAPPARHTATDLPVLTTVPGAWCCTLQQLLPAFVALALVQLHVAITSTITITITSLPATATNFVTPAPSDFFLYILFFF